MGRFECEDVDDSLDELISIFAQELGDDFIVVPKYFIKAGVNSVFFKLDGMVQDDIQPIFADVEFRDPISFDDLPDEVVGPVEHSF